MALSLLATRAYADLPTYGPDGTSARAVSATEIDLVWNPVIANPSVTGYKIERESPLGGGFTTIVINTNSAAGSYNDTGLSPNTIYSYRVTAINSDGAGLSSANPFFATTLSTAAYVPPPDAPAGITLTPADAFTVNISWVAPAGTITSYNINRNVAGGLTPLATGIAGTSYTDTNLSPGGTYGYQIIAVNSAGTGTPSPTVYVTMPTIPSAPGNVTAVAADSQAMVTWTPAYSAGGGVTGYVVSGTPNGSASVGSGTLSAVLTGLTNGTLYLFSVAATNIAGTGPAALSNSVRPATSTPATSPSSPPVFTPTIPTLPPISTGAPAPIFHFSTALSVGSRDAAVTALQNYLIAKKFYAGPVTGYFGALTRKAVQIYQTAHAIQPVGNVGPLTRAYLNANQ